MQTNIPGMRLAILIVLGASLQACTSPKSSSTSGPGGGQVPTSTMTLDLRVESSEPGKTVVRANLNNGRTLPTTSYRLDGGDFLRACMNGVCRSMADNDSVYEPDYIARFDFVPGVDHVVSFSRQEGQNAPDSRASLPPAFVMVTPANHQQVTDGETVIVSWMPSGAPARVGIDYEAQCTLLSGVHVFSVGFLGTDSNADGSEPVDIDHIVDFAASNEASPITRCSIDVIVSHELQGHVDPAFDHGTAVGVVSRKVNLDYVPD